MFAVCHGPGPVLGLEDDGVQLTGQEGTFRLGLGKGGEMALGRWEKAFQARVKVLR